METPKFLAVHFDGDYLEHAAFVNTEKEASQLTCRISPGDHWSPVLIPIETAAAAPDLLTACNGLLSRMQYYYNTHQDLCRLGDACPDKKTIHFAKAAIAKATP